MLKTLNRKIDQRIREKAIERTKSRIILSGKTIADISDDDKEIIVNEEIGKIKDEYKTKGLYSLLALFGISFI